MAENSSIDLSNSREVIFEYAGLTDTHKKHLAELLDQYRESMDKSNAAPDELRKLRKELSAYFYELYKVVFFKTVDETERIPKEVLMFLFFGYIDDKLAGKENAEKLYELVDTVGFDEEGRVFTFYQWLRMIYIGKKEPSINEFSMDYTAYLREQKKTGAIGGDDEMRLLKDSRRKVEFELKNMFVSANRMMTSTITSFCPFFTKYSVYKPLDQIIFRPEAIHRTMEVLRAIDPSAFFRETLYSNPEAGIPKEIIKLEVKPDIILMPCVGDRATMWQEITGAKRTTPGRFILPILEMEEHTKTLIRLIGEFRWELCRRIQGARWNDLSERSLTSDYCDYLATYKKNRDLSPEAREKIKMNMVKFRNSSKEMFVNDYMNYMLSESQGSIRLNKVARRILFTYCYFGKPIRDALTLNPQYQKMIEIFTNKINHDRHLYSIALSRLENAGKKIPEEMTRYRDFLSM